MVWKSLIFVCVACFCFGQNDPWSQWRGPNGTGVSDAGTPPTQWDESKNIRWKVQVPGTGNSSPVVWGSHVFVTSSVPILSSELDAAKIAEMKEAMPGWMKNSGAITPKYSQAFTLFCYDLKKGTLAWKKVLREGFPHEGTHADGTWAPQSPATNGKYIFAFFGSNGLYCLDMKANVLWQKDFGKMKTRNSFGEGSTPFLYKDKVVINWDHEGQSFIVVLDQETGKEIWKKQRDEPTSWSSPIVVNHQGVDQVIVAATKATRGYDLTSGKVLWEVGGLTLNVIPTPIYDQGSVYVTSGFRGSALQAIDLAKAGTHSETNPALRWAVGEDTPYVPSPLLYDQRLYYIKVNQGILTCVDTKTGKTLFGPQRLGSIKGVYASLVGANQHVYITGRKGTTLVIKNQDTFEVVAENTLDDRFDASAAIAGDALLLRGHKNLYCIAE